MPIMTGMELYREVARVAREQAERMSFVTGCGFTEKERQLLSETQTECVEEPFNWANLRVIMQR